MQIEINHKYFQKTFSLKLNHYIVTSTIENPNHLNPPINPSYLPQNSLNLGRPDQGASKDCGEWLYLEIKINYNEEADRFCVSVAACVPDFDGIERCFAHPCGGTDQLAKNYQRDKAMGAVVVDGERR